MTKEERIAMASLDHRALRRELGSRRSRKTCTGFMIKGKHKTPTNKIKMKALVKKKISEIIAA